MIFQIGEKIINYSGTVSTEKSGTIRPKYPFTITTKHKPTKIGKNKLAMLMTALILVY